MLSNALRIVVMSVLLSPGLVKAVPIMWEGNGNLYEIVAVDVGLTWDDARAAAEAMGGHLATITSAEENAWLFDTFALNGTAFWLGGFQDPAGAEPADGWQWVTGEAFDFTAWAFGEPNDQGVEGEDVLSVAFFEDNTWNDAPADFLYPSPFGGYVVEYEIPEPGSLAILIVGLAGLGAARRRSRR